MVYLHFPSNLTDEEIMLQNKYAKLRKKKKALHDFQSPKPEPEKINPLKRTLEPKDAKEFAKKLILSGKISVPIKNSAQKTLFKRPLGLERKLSEGRSPASGGFSPAPGESNYSPSGGMTPFPGSSSPSFHFEPFTPSTPDSSSFSLPGSSGGSSGGSNSGTNRIPFSGGGGRFGGPIPRTKKFTTAAIIPPYNFKEPGTGVIKEFPMIIKKEFGGGSSGSGGPKQGHTIHIRGKGKGTLTETLCRDVFSKIGSIVSVNMEMERSCAFVTFSKIETAEKAIKEMNGTYQMEVLLEVSFARRQPAVTELINDASASATWMALASNQSQKGSHKDKRAPQVYEDI